jgi:hypothetical protein
MGQSERTASAGADVDANGPGRRQVLKGSGAAALGISALALPSAAQAFSLTVNGAAVSGVTVYWAERGSTSSADGRIGRLVYSGDSVISNVDNAWLTSVAQPQYLTTDGISLYYSNVYSGSEQGIWRVGIDKTRTRIVADVSSEGFFVDATHLYYGANGTIFRVAKDGTGSTETLASPGTSLRDIAVAGDTLYFAEFNEGRIRTIPKDGGSITDLVVGLPAQSPNRVEVAGGLLYLGMNSPSQVRRFGLDGSPAGTIIAAGSVVGLQIVDTVLFVGSSNFSAVTASGLDGGNPDTFMTTGQDPLTIVSTSALHGMAILP